MRDRIGELHVGMLGADTAWSAPRPWRSAVGIAAILRWPVRPFLSARTSCAHGARVGDDGARPVQHPLALGREARKREVRCTSMTPSVSSSCLMPAENVGWVTPQASAARAEILFPRQRDQDIRACRSLVRRRSTRHRDHCRIFTELAQKSASGGTKVMNHTLRRRAVAVAIDGSGGWSLRYTGKRLGADTHRSNSSCRPAPAAAPTRWRASSRASSPSTS